MRNYILLSEKKWNKNLADQLKASLPEYNWILIDSKADFTKENLQKIAPLKIFIPHWSHIISEDIFNSFECVVFHMTDLPYGRGGSPLQNLIVRGHKKTKISALRVVEELDAGPIYLKQELELSGTAKDIFIRSNSVIFEMIIKIIKNRLLPIAQEGEPVVFKRRKPSQGNIENLKDIEQIYDYIRMLDADGYPRAFLETENFKLEFDNVSREAKHILSANVRIIQK